MSESRGGMAAMLMKTDYIIYIEEGTDIWIPNQQMPALHAWCISIMATRGRHLASHSNLNRTAAKSESVGGSSRVDKIPGFVRHSICKRFSSNIFKKKFWMALPLWLRVCVQCALTRRCVHSCACALLPVFSYPHVHRLSDFKASRILVNSRIRYSRNSLEFKNSCEF
jgi:hypothetical protein